MLPPSTLSSFPVSLYILPSLSFIAFPKVFPLFSFFHFSRKSKRSRHSQYELCAQADQIQATHSTFIQAIHPSFYPSIHYPLPPPSPSSHGSQRDFYCAAAPLPVVLMRFQTIFSSLLNIENKYFHSLGVNWKNRTRNKSHSSPACIFTYFPLVLLLMIGVFS